MCERRAIYQNNRAGVGKQITNELFGMQILEAWYLKAEPSESISGNSWCGGCLLEPGPWESLGNLGEKVSQQLSRNAGH